MNEILFTVAAAVVAYAYAGYPLILLMLPKRLITRARFGESLPTVTVLIPARNEAAHIKATLESLAGTDYPRKLLRIIVISDASTDDTNEIVNNYRERGVELLRLEQRVGKYGAMQEALAVCSSDILIFADSSSIFQKDSLSTLIRPFSNPAIGAVTGAKSILPSDSTVASGDGLYWRYDAWLRERETRAGSSWVGVEGGFFGVRRQLLLLDFPRHIAADYAICCRIYEQGYLHAYVATARIYESATSDMRHEFSRKIRVIVRGIQALIFFRYLLNPIKHPFFTFQNISHRVVRWLVPFFLIVLLVTSAASHSTLIHATFYPQVAFYLLAVAGALINWPHRWARLTEIPWYFATVNLAALFSWFMLHRKFDIWSPTDRDARLKVSKHKSSSIDRNGAAN